MNKATFTAAAVLATAAVIVAIQARRSPDPGARTQDSPASHHAPATTAAGKPAGPRDRAAGERSHPLGLAVGKLLLGRVDPSTIDKGLLWDDSAPIKQRRRTAWHLATSDDPRHFGEVTAYLASGEGDPRVMATILEALGSSPMAGARDWLLAALESTDAQLLRGTLRGLSKTDRAEDAARFRDLLLSAQQPASVRAEAARALGRLSTPAAGRLLMDAHAAAAGDEILRGLVNEAMALRDVAESGPFFRRLLADSDDPDARAELVDSLSHARGDTSPLLLEWLNDPDSGVRAEAAWNLGMLEGDHSAALLARLAREPEDEVRQRIYQALQGGELADVGALFRQAGREQDPDTRLAAYTLVAGQLRQAPGPEQAAQIRQTLLQEFEQVALGGTNPGRRMQAVIGIKQLRGGDAEASLRRIASESSDPRVVKATGLGEAGGR